MTGEYWYLFYILLFVVAFLYASVGHGGASGYLALMAIYSVSPAEMKPTALLFPIARFLFFPNADVRDMKESKLVPSLLIGGAIGLLSGMIGIGGGILL